MSNPFSVGLPLAAAFAALLPAQRVSIDAVAATTMVANCSVPGLSPVALSAPAGTPADAIGLYQPLLLNGPDFAAVSVDGVFTQGASTAQLTLFDRAQARGQGRASTGPHDVLLTLSSALPLRVVVDILWNGSATAVPAPVATIDIGDDGTREFVAQASGQALSVPLTIGATPFAIRMHTALSAQDRITTSTLQVTVRPDLFTATPLGDGCNSTLVIGSTFEQELTLAARPLAPAGALSLLVIGTGLQPRVLPGPLGCQLLPDPLAVAVLPEAGLRFDLAALPPIAVAVQAVQLLPASAEAYSSQTLGLNLP